MLILCKSENAQLSYSFAFWFQILWKSLLLTEIKCNKYFSDKYSWRRLGGQKILTIGSNLNFLNYVLNNKLVFSKKELHTFNLKVLNTFLYLIGALLIKESHMVQRASGPLNKPFKPQIFTWINKDYFVTKFIDFVDRCIREKVTTWQLKWFNNLIVFIFRINI